MTGCDIVAALSRVYERIAVVERRRRDCCLRQCV